MKEKQHLQTQSLNTKMFVQITEFRASLIKNTIHNKGLISILQFKWFFEKILRTVILLLVAGLIAACGSLVHHRVEKGDTLYSIGFYYGQDHEDIAQWNNIKKPYIIHEGQWIRVAPPTREWWEEDSKQTSSETISKNKKQIIKRPDKKNKELARKRVVVAEDFTDRQSPVKAWVWPTTGRLLKNSKSELPKNNGINIEGKRGQPIVATAAGKVVYSGSGLIGYGQLIIIKHNKEYLSAYAYNEKMLVREGDMVSQGQKIALMGRHTRDNIDLLHFEIRKNGKPVDPLRLLDKRSH